MWTFDLNRTLFLALVLLFCVASASTCGSAAEGPDAAESSVTSSAPRPARADAPPELPLVSESALQPDALSPDVRACLPEPDLGFDVDFYEVARARDGADQYVYLEWFDALTADAAFDSHPALLRFRGSACDVLVQPGFEAEEINRRALVPPAVADELDVETLAWKVAVAGGPEAYVARIREIYAQIGQHQRECTPGHVDRSCAPSAYAAQLRGLGIEVLPPN